MKKLFFRIKRRWKITVAGFKNDTRFSIKFAIYRIVDNLLGRMGLQGLSQYFHNKKIAYELEYLEANLSRSIKKYVHNDSLGVKTENAPIWLCWWTGMDKAPEIVKQCVRSIQYRAGTHPVYIITEDNFLSFLEIPKFIYDKMQKKQMGYAHFADYIRVSLLNKYGGLWLDATIYCSDWIPEWYFEMPFFTCKSEYRESRYISHYQWVTFCLGGWKLNVFYSFLQDAFEEYWEKNEYAIDYLFFDDLIWIAKEHIPSIKRLMEDVPLNTPHRDDLQAAFNKNLPADAFSSIICEDTPLNKLSWREKYKETTDDGQESIYAFFLKNTIEDK